MQKQLAVPCFADNKNMWNGDDVGRFNDKTGYKCLKYFFENKSD